MRKVGFYSLVFFFLIAGVNHFINPDFYFPLIPSYLPWPKAINSISGIAEICGALFLWYGPTRRLAAVGLLILLVAFIPSHVYFIQLGGCVSEGLCVPLWVAWLRLVIVHPILMYWVYAQGIKKRTHA